MVQLKDVTPIIRAILNERDKIPRVIDKERYIPNPQPYHYGDFMRGGIRKALRVIEQAPVVDAVPVVHARWALFEGCWACSECGCSPADWEQKPNNPYGLPPYCHCCGAKMDGEPGV